MNQTILIGTLFAFAVLGPVFLATSLKRLFQPAVRGPSSVGVTAVLAAAAGALAYGIFQVGGLYFPQQVVPGSIQMTTFDGMYDIPPGVWTLFPAESITSISIDAPKLVSVGTTYQIDLTSSRRGNRSKPYKKGEYVTSLDGPPYTKYRGIPPCAQADRQNATPNPDGKRACANIPNPVDELKFSWLVDASETGVLIHNLSIQSLEPFPRELGVRARGRGLPGDTTSPQSSVPRGSLLNERRAFTGQVDEKEPWAFILSNENKTVHLTDPGKIAEVNAIRADLVRGTIYIPVEILTRLGLRESTEGWLKALGAILAVLLTAGLGKWIFGRRERNLPDNS